MRQLLILIVPLFLLAACAASEPGPGAQSGGSGDLVYPISARQADSVLRGAIRRSFAGSAILRVGSPNPGYSSVLRFGIDRHVFFALREPATGKKPNGQIVEGFVFRVIHRGTMPFSGPARARKLMARIQRRARQLAQPLQYAEGPATGSPSGGKKSGIGSGFVINASGDILTNNHVAAGCKILTIASGGIKYPAVFRYGDKRNDLAVIRSSSLPVRSVAKFRSSQLNLGEKVVVVGYPLGKEVLGAGMKATTGNVSGLTGTEGNSSRFQFTAPIQPGNSGGPVIDERAAISGVASASLNQTYALKVSGSLSQLINLAIKPQTVFVFLKANGIAYVVSRARRIKTTVNIVSEARGYTVQIFCN